eukprot:351083-Chlamydomonas_euryale.AAC.8
MLGRRLRGRLCAGRHEAQADCVSVGGPSARLAKWQSARNTDRPLGSLTFMTTGLSIGCFELHPLKDQLSTGHNLFGTGAFYPQHSVCCFGIGATEMRMASYCGCLQ